MQRKFKNSIQINQIQFTTGEKKFPVCRADSCLTHAVSPTLRQIFRKFWVRNKYFETFDVKYCC